MIPLPSRRRTLGILGGLAAAPLARVQAQVREFPGRPIRVVIGFPAGGTQDILTRAIGQRVQNTLGVLVVDNHSGAAGRIAAEMVKNAKPDGHTLYLGPAGVMSIFPNVYPHLKFDPVKDFEPVANAASFQLAMVAHRSVTANTVQEFVAWAKTQGNNGDGVSFASFGAGTASHLLGEMFNRATGLRMVHVAYRGSSPAQQDLMGGTVPVYFDTVGGAVNMLPTGRVKVLATSGVKRAPQLPAIPTFVELKYDDVIASAWFGYFAPAGTPKKTIETLSGEIIRAVNTAEVRAVLVANGMYPVGDGPDELRKTLHDDIERWGRIARAINFVAAD